MQAFVVPLIHVLERQLAGREGADAAGDQDGAARILVLVGDDREQRLAVLLGLPERDDFLREMHGPLPLEPLLRHSLHEILGKDLGKSGDIEDVFLRIERRELPPYLIEIVDQAV